ncbi:hypothetical protein ACWCP6_15860 [Streptomyces sp. NPDC002004]
MVIAVTLLSGNATAPWLPMPGPQGDPPAGRVETSPLPSGSAKPPEARGATPGTAATGSTGSTPVPRGSRAPAPSGSAAPEATERGTTPTGAARGGTRRRRGRAAAA